MNNIICKIFGHSWKSAERQTSPDAKNGKVDTVVLIIKYKICSRCGATKNKNNY